MGNRLSENFDKCGETNLRDMKTISEEEKHKILYEFNNTKVEYPRNKSVVEIFEEVVSEAKENIALTSNGINLTYGELNERANKIANFLIEKGVKRDNVVGILCDRSVESIVVILGVVKAGAAYMPIDEEYPKQRIEYMLQDSGSKILLGKKNNLEELNLEEVSAKTIYIESEEIKNKSIENPNIINLPEDTIYLIYTSGSTGKPKGVGVEHRGIVRLVKNTDFMIFRENHKFLKNISMSFDPSALEIWGSLLNKMTLVVIKKEITMDGNKLSDVIEEENIKAMILPTPLFNNYGIDKPAMFKNLEYLIVGGDVISPKAISKTVKICNKLKIINAYGPTENSVVSTEYIVCGEWNENKTVPIGKPIANSTAYIMSKNNELLPIGVSGELLVGGDGIAKGYLNREELNKEKFIENPYIKGERIYKTGDLARWLPDGNIEFLGRIDNQVKIRGFRIELGEIEKQLLKNEDIKQALVMDIKKDNDEYLCAYIIADKEISIPKLKEDMLKEFPNYMVPTYIMQLESMPLNQNGKIDRKVLPKPEIRKNMEYVAPRNEIEEKISGVLSELFGIDKIGINEKFFDLGGDSIKAIQVVSRLRKIGISLEIKYLLKNNSISEMSQYASDRIVKAEQGMVEGEFLFTPIQKEFIDEYGYSMNNFNQSFMVYSKTRLDENAVERSIKKIVEHHDVLRLVIKENNKVLKVYNRGLEGKLYGFKIHNFENIKEYDCRIKEEVNNLQCSMDLENGPLVKVAIFKTMKGDHLLIIIQHMVVDGVSWRIILEDFMNLYKAEKEGKVEVLPDKTTSFKEWSEKLYNYANSNKIKKELKYWSNIAEEKVDVIEKDTGSIDNEDNIVVVKFSKESTEKLLKQANKAYNTEINDIFISALAMAVRKWKKLNKIAINLEGHGREDIIQGVDITRTVGWFTSCYPVILDLKEENISRMIKITKENLRKIPNKGIGYGIIKYLREEENKKEVNMDIKTSINFNYLGQFDEDVKSSRELEYSKLSSERDLTLDFVGFDFKPDYDINMNGMVQNGQLYMNIEYTLGAFNKKSIQEFANAFESSLEDIINHCVNKNEVEYTPSDYGINEYTVDELDEIRESLRKNIGEDIVLQKINKLTPMQAGMFFTYLKDKETTAYVIQEVLNIEGDLDLDILNKTYKKIIEREEVLRTIIVEHWKHPSQIILKNREAQIGFEDFSIYKEDKELKYEEYKIKDVKEGFDLSKDILYRINVAKMAEKKYKLLVTTHHIILDGWSLPTTISEIFSIYSSLINKTEIPRKDIAKFDCYVKWLENQDEEKGIEYWKNYLEAYDNEVKLPKQKVNSKEYEDGNYEVIIKAQETRILEDIAVKNGVTLSTILQTAWAILLQKYSNKNDIVFGSVVSGRPEELMDVEKILGIFINTVPIRIKDMTGKKFIKAVKETQNLNNESKKYEYVSLAEIQNDTVNKQNLISSLFVFENYPTESYTDKFINNLSIIREFGREETNYDLNLIGTPGEEFKITLMYNKNIYDSEFIKILVKQLELIFNQIVKDSEILSEKIEIVNEDEKNKILYEFNNTKSEYPRDKSVHELFEEVVKQCGDKIALVSNGIEISYEELNKRANRIANMLREKGVTRESIVPVICDRSLETVIGMLGIVKAGGAYLPIDEGYPEERISYMIEDSGSKIGIAKGKLIEKFNLKYIDVIDINSEELEKESNENPNIITTPKDLIYIIYTSGSTGKPKGVCVENRNVVRLVKNTNYVELNLETRILQTGSMAFDASTFELWGSLLNGITLHIEDKDLIMDSNKIKEYIDKNKITTMWLTASLFNVFAAENNTVFNNLKHLLVGGDIVVAKYVNEIKKNNIGIKIINGYGPTENTTFSTTYTIDNIWDEDRAIPIGKPILNSTAYIMDKNNKLLPAGVPGELYVGGDGVARGYLNRLDLTAEKFIENPYVKGERIYKTGDLARWLPDGNIEFLGRLDYQVKIRGFRIELGEIERVIFTNKKIKETVVMVRECTGEKQLCAYYTGNDIEAEELKEYMKNKLPEYMIPLYIQKLESMPLNRNGKIDRKKLPQIEDMILGGKYEKPRNEIEEKLSNIYSEVLGIRNVGIKDNFFELGGHSLKAINLVSRIKKDIGANVQVGNIFKYPTIEEIAACLESTKENFTYNKIEKAKEKEYYEASSAQKRMYAINQTNKESTNYNVTYGYLVHGLLEKDKMYDVLRQLILRHEALRTYFDVVDGIIVQKIKEEPEVILKYIEYENKFEDLKEEVNSIINEFKEPFDLNNGPLIKSLLLNFKDKSLLILDMHHIISDGTSVNLIYSEISQLYKGEELRAQNLQYKDFSEWQNNLLKTEKIIKQENFWLDYFKDGVSKLDLPKDYEKKNEYRFKGDSLSIELEEEAVEKIDIITKIIGVTKPVFFQLVTSILFYRYTNQEEIILGVPVSGRVEEDINNIVGMFVNTLPIKTKIKTDISFKSLLKEENENLMKALENQEYQLEILIDKLFKTKQILEHKLFDVIYSYNHFNDLEYFIGEFKAEPFDVKYDTSTMDLVIVVNEESDTKIKIIMEYDSEVYSEETINFMLSDLKQLIKTTLKENGDIMIEDIVFFDSNSETKNRNAKIVSNEIDDFDF